MENLFKDLNAELFAEGIDPRTQKSRDWFEEKVREIRRIDRKELMNSEEVMLSRKALLGRMYMFFYRPEGAAELPYYDRFPVVIVTEVLKGGFKGINLHYLPIDLRSILLGNLLDRLNNNRADVTTKFKIDYKILNSNRRFRYYKPCYKHYKMNNIKGNMARIMPDEFEIASFLPTALFKKKTEKYVHVESRKMIRRGSR
jgi:hypothetical protein